MTKAQNTEDALVYLTDCTLATVDDLAMRKRPPVREYRRQKNIAQFGIDWIQKMANIPTSSRVKDVIDEFSGSVEAYAESIEKRHKPDNDGPSPS